MSLENAGAGAAVGPSISQAQVSILSPQGFQAAMTLAETLVGSGFLPSAIQEPAQALAIILAGQELGLPPMRSLREINIIQGKPCMSAELMLSQFKRKGGRAEWVSSDESEARLRLVAPNGDKHEEVFTLGDAAKAGIGGKDNWKKYPKAMLRARCSSAGLRALGYADGVYDPDEMGAVTTPSGEVVELPEVEIRRSPEKTPAEKLREAEAQNQKIKEGVDRETASPEKKPAEPKKAPPAQPPANGQRKDIVIAGAICPKCQNAGGVINNKYGSGKYLCWKNRGGCGEKFEQYLTKGAEVKPPAKGQGQEKKAPAATGEQWSQRLSRVRILCNGKGQMALHDEVMGNYCLDQNISFADFGQEDFKAVTVALEERLDNMGLSLAN